jgi:hypothetical protein
VVRAAACYHAVASFDPQDMPPMWSGLRVDATAALPAIEARIGMLRVDVDRDADPEASVDGVRVSWADLEGGVVVDPGEHRVVALGRHGTIVGQAVVVVGEGEVKSAALGLAQPGCASGAPAGGEQKKP